MEQLIKDDRFNMMFEDEEFARDVNSEAYKQVRPVSDWLKTPFLV